MNHDEHENDPLCLKAGQQEHRYCGMCGTHDCPRSLCGCVARLDGREEDD